jgi:protein-S-isoprenylcysteine O-methyltransferase
MSSLHDDDSSDDFDQRIQQRLAATHTPGPLEMDTRAEHDRRNYYGGRFPNTPLAAATVAFVLGGVFFTGVSIFTAGGLPLSTWKTYQLGFFVASWAAFHYGEFAVTAGWNRDRCNIDCESQPMSRSRLA